MFRGFVNACHENSAIRLFVLIIIFNIAPTNLLAGDVQYVCKIDGVSKLENGVLVADQGGLYRIYRDSTIYIDRRSGEITGPWILDVKASGHRINVLDKGSSSNSFKALAVRGPQVYYIEVIEFDKTYKKSFLIYHNTTLWHGLCG